MKRRTRPSSFLDKGMLPGCRCRALPAAGNDTEAFKVRMRTVGLMLGTLGSRMSQSRLCTVPPVREILWQKSHLVLEL